MPNINKSLVLVGDAPINQTTDIRKMLAEVTKDGEIHIHATMQELEQHRASSTDALARGLATLLLRIKRQEEACRTLDDALTEIRGCAPGTPAAALARTAQAVVDACYS